MPNSRKCLYPFELHCRNDSCPSNFIVRPFLPCPNRLITMQPSMKKRFTRILPTVVLHSAILGIHVDAARRCETAVEGVVSAKLATSCEKNLLALTHALFTQPVRFMQLSAFSHRQWLGLSPNRRRTKGYERIARSQSNNMPTTNNQKS